eukprot:11312005-Alexandrium_andersonii.AAC.1
MDWVHCRMASPDHPSMLVVMAATGDRGSGTAHTDGREWWVAARLRGRRTHRQGRIPTSRPVVL